MNDTSGFYTYGTELNHAPTFVCAKLFELHRDLKDTYKYPVHDWYWFDSESEARAFFGLPEISINNNTTL